MNTSIGADRLLDSLTSIKLCDLALIKIQSQAMAEALRVLVVPGPDQSFLYRRAATLRAREVLAAFDAMPDVFGYPPCTLKERGREIVSFDEKPDGDPHGECAAEIDKLMRANACMQWGLECAQRFVALWERGEISAEGVLPQIKLDIERGLAGFAGDGEVEPHA